MAFFVGCFLLLMPVLAQEGHPLVGTWHGDWGPTATHRNDVTLVLDWDGKNITGLINPGPESIKLSKAALRSKSMDGALRSRCEGSRRQAGSLHDRWKD